MTINVLMSTTADYYNVILTEFDDIICEISFDERLIFGASAVFYKIYIDLINLRFLIS